MASNNQSETTHVRAPESAPKRITKLGQKLERARGGRWPQAAVVDEALKTLETKVESEAA
jgi:hypothetical protein